MDILHDFAQKDMIEQITILEEIKEVSSAEVVGRLLDLHANPLGDQPIDEMIYHTLFDLLAGRENEIMAGLRHNSMAVRLLCVRRAGDETTDTVKSALINLLKDENDFEVIGETIRALGKFDDSGLLDILQPYLQHDDYTVVTWTMRTLTGSGDLRVRDTLINMVAESSDLKHSAVGCDLRIALAVENLTEFSDDKTSRFLMRHIHNPNPAFRRVVISALISMGAAIPPILEACLDTGSKDEKIMAVNIIGLIGEKKSADLLIARLENVDNQNLRFAIYEALGRIRSMRSIVGLVDGLAEQDDLTLIAVITGLNNLCNPGVIKILHEILNKKDEQSERVIKTIITAHAVQLFSALYNNGHHAETLITTIIKSNDSEAINLFREQLAKIKGDKAAADLARLTVNTKERSAKRILAADDSKAMLFFYKKVAAELGINLVTVTDGKQALNYLQSDDNFDLIITDMNMPHMDGIELTQEIRKRTEWSNIPILMASTESETSQSDLALKTGVTDFITKPFTLQNFKDRIEQMIKNNHKPGNTN